MEKFKTLVIYAIIGVLCVTALTGFLYNKSKGSVVQNNQPISNKAQSEEKNQEENVTEKAQALPDAGNVIGIGLGNEYAAATATALENAGGIKPIIKKGGVVLIKPNICTLAEPGAPVITDYRVVQKVVEMVRASGAGRIIIAEGSIIGSAFDKANLKANKYDTIQGVELININGFDKEDCYAIKPEKSNTGKELYIPKIYMDADVVINVAKLKTHDEGVVTLSLKNLFGVASTKVYGKNGYRVGLHSMGLEKAIVDMNLIRKPDISIIEGIVGGEGSGPIKNTPVKSNIILAGKDQVALDTVALTLMGFKIDQVPHVKLAAQNGIGTSDLDKIKVVGADLNSIKMDFKSPFK